jgi:hypothetical protein
MIIIECRALLDRFGTVERAKQALYDWVRSLGCILKCTFSYCSAEAEFLSRRFYPIGSMFVVGVKPGRLLSKVGWFIHKQGTKDSTYFAYLYGTLLSLKDTTHHVPFARVYVSKLIAELERQGHHPRFHEKVEFWLTGQELVEADEGTWAAFTNIYGLTKADEELFGHEIDRAITRGLPYMLQSRYVDRMVDVDFSM